MIVMMGVLGLGMGSFVNALVWRLYQQSQAIRQAQAKESGAKPFAKLRPRSPEPKKGKAPTKHTPHTGRLTSGELSILKGRSMCVDCHHTLAAKDLIPILSWLSLRGKCRYCHQAVSWQYPLVELLTAGLFMVSYLFWPYGFDAVGSLQFGVWLALLIGFVALAVYDLRWFLLPNRIVYLLLALAGLQALAVAALAGSVAVFTSYVLGCVIGGGLFYLLFQVSGGRWIGGGDVKLGFLLGLTVGGPVSSLLMLFLASFLGTLVTVPLLLSGRASRKSVVPFGPFLIAAAIIVQLFGASLVLWYTQRFLAYGG